jgi:hypothetical protein
MPPQKPLLTSRLATCVNRFHLYIAIQIRLSRSHRRADVVRSGTKINGIERFFVTYYTFERA